MKYYGERTQRLYDTAGECQQAEFKAKEQENREKILAERKAAEAKEKKKKEASKRKARAAEVEAARKTMVEAQKAYKDKLESFIKTYSTYHFSSTDINDFPTLFNFFSDWF